MRGWIKVYRKLQEKGFYTKSQYVHLWIHLLFRANKKSQEFLWNKKMIIIKEGQLLTGRKQLALETGIAEGTIEKILKMFEIEHQIEQQKTTKFRVITILNYKEHQDSEQQIEQRGNNRGTTEEQQKNTNKKDKKEEEYIGDVQKLWIKTWGRNPTIPESEETEGLIKKFGYDKTHKIMRQSQLDGFRNFGTLIRSLDDEGNIKPKENLYKKEEPLIKKKSNKCVLCGKTAQVWIDGFAGCGGDHIYQYKRENNIGYI